MRNFMVGAAIGAVVTLIINYILIDIPVLKSQVTDLREDKKDLNNKIDKINEKLVDNEKHDTAIEQFLYYKYGYNPSAFINAVNQNNVSSEDAKKALSIPNKDAERYLINNLHFTPAEANLVVSKPITQNNK